MDASLKERSGGVCELCGSNDALRTYPVAPKTDLDASSSAALCGTCSSQIDSTDLEARHWHCLQEAAWSDVAPVQVLSWRLLTQLRGESWAADLLDQLYVPDDVLEWARDTGTDSVKVTDCNGEVLQTGDTVTLIKDLDVKGANFTAKRGTMVKGIHVTDDPTHVEGKVNKIAIFLKTEFIKKVR